MDEIAAPPRRKPGRPRKTPLPADPPQPQSVTSMTETIAAACGTTREELERVTLAMRGFSCDKTLGIRDMMRDALGFYCRERLRCTAPRKPIPPITT